MIMTTMNVSSYNPDVRVVDLLLCMLMLVGVYLMNGMKIFFLVS